MNAVFPLFGLYDVVDRFLLSQIWSTCIWWQRYLDYEDRDGEIRESKCYSLQCLCEWSIVEAMLSSREALHIFKDSVPTAQ